MKKRITWIIRIGRLNDLSFYYICVPAASSLEKC